MSLRPLAAHAAAALLATLLAACAGGEALELAGASWEDNPESLWVVENELYSNASYRCRGGWDLLSKSRTQESGRHVSRWTINCMDPRP